MRTIAFLGALLLTTAASAQDHSDHGASATPAKSPAAAETPAPAAPGDYHGQMQAPAARASEPATTPAGKGRILHYKNPMGEPDTSPVPKKDSMGMDYIPVYASDVAPTITDHAADRFFDANAMAAARTLLKTEHGGEPVSLLMVNIFELQSRKGEEGYRWEGEGWYGGDIHRAVVKFKGEGEFGGKVDKAELQALYARAIGPYFNLQAGLRYDVRPEPSRAYATVGVEGLAPYWFELGAAFFVSEKGDAHARLEAYYDLNVTQRLILQPRAEIDIAAQDVPELKTGAGISTVEAELRLRYEIRREFAPYVGVTFERKIGQTATFARDAGERVSATSFVAGIRFMF